MRPAPGGPAKSVIAAPAGRVNSWLEQSAEGAPMPTRRAIIGFVLAAALGAAGASVAAEMSAKEFVTKIYSAYKGKDAQGAFGTSEEELMAVFEPSLAKLILKD